MNTKLFRYFLQGLFYLAPFVVTIYILYEVIIFFDKLFLKITNINVPGIGILIMIVSVTILGLLTDMYLARPIIGYIQGIISKIPVVKEVYFPLKDIFDALLGKNRKFTKPVLVKVNPVTNVDKIGFIMQESLKELNIKENKVAVYFPHSYAFSGELYIVPAEYVTPLDIPASVALKFIVSGGAILQTKVTETN
ncbi:MAG: DUF502 domain-containing protein [Bacteroidales bacterium]|nr:DUF502 domain-containing protein [Bacteroidales bacterium]